MYEKRAVDCIIYGISDKSVNSAALALRCRPVATVSSSKESIIVSERLGNRQFKSGNDLNLSNRN